MKGPFLFGKGVMIFLIIAMTVGVLGLWVRTYVLGAYYAHSGIFMALVVGILPVVLVVSIVWIIRKLINLTFNDVFGE